MLLSVIIPCYNGSRTVAATLDNLVRELDATCSYEIIVVNDGSTDNSADILANFAMKHPSIRIFAKDNGGVSSARNYGLRHASGDYIWFFDADDLCFDGAMEKLISLLNQYRPDICNFWSLTVDARMKNNVDQYNNYLTHIYIARDLYWSVFNNVTLHTFPRTFLIATLTLLTGYLLTYLLSRVPKGKYIIGT